MSRLKRDPVKYIRDKAKSKYAKDTECRICGAATKLDFHHYNTVAILVHKWFKDKGYDPELVLAYREEFIEEHQTELYDEAVTLCHPHHLELHRVYGKDPALITAPKQQRWVEKQRIKHGMD